MKKSHGPAFLKARPIFRQCTDCSGKGLSKGLFYELDCATCEGIGIVHDDTGVALELSELPAYVRYLNTVISQMSRARPVMVNQVPGAQQQYEQNNRRGAGGSNYTGD